MCDSVGPTQTAVSAEPAGSEDSAPHPAQRVVIGGRYRLNRRVGAGAFGEVYSGTDIETNVSVAIKLEVKSADHPPHLQAEARLLSYLTRGVMSVGIPQMLWYGENGEYHVMVLELLGPSLGELFEYLHHRFDIKTCCMLADQMISRLEFIHAQHFIHRDLKPENFLMGVGKRSHHVYLIDFGLSKRYRDSRTREHIPFVSGKSLTGTARYVSIHTHLGHQQSRRDDMESVGHILCYFALGQLPWQGVRGATKQEKYHRIQSIKMQTSVADLCRGLPSCFASFMTYCRALRFQEEPDYERCRDLFSNDMALMGYKHDFMYQWLTRTDPSTPSQSLAFSESMCTALGSSAWAVRPSASTSSLPAGQQQQQQQLPKGSPMSTRRVARATPGAGSRTSLPAVGSPYNDLIALFEDGAEGDEPPPRQVTEEGVVAAASSAAVAQTGTPPA